MRIHKYRAWDKQEKRMCQSLQNWEFGKREFFPFGIAVGFSHYEENQDNWEIMQYTGLKDKNGKEIYEGDIVKDVVGLMVVRFKDGQFGGMTGTEFGDWAVRFIADKVEIIGNIYENPNLLSHAS